MAIHFFRDHIYPYLVDVWGNPPPIQKIRQKIIPFAQGKVLEIGAGSGANFPHYDPAKVSMLYALEPNPGMVRLAEKKAHRNLNIEYLDLPGEHIPLDDGTINTVVSTFTLCTIPGIKDAIQGIARILNPEGKLIFFELGLSPDSVAKGATSATSPKSPHHSTHTPQILRQVAQIGFDSCFSLAIPHQQYDNDFGNWAKYPVSIC